MNKKKLLATILSNTALLPVLRKIQTSLSNTLIILAYHRIADIGTEDNYPFDPELISATPLNFSDQMHHIKKHFNPVSLNDVIEYQQGKKKLPKKPIVITFDDGHEDNYTNAYPILKSLKIPATIFLSTEYIGSNKIFWFDWVAHTIYQTKVNHLSINDNLFSIDIGTNVLSRRSAAKNILRYLMTLQNNKRILCLNEIEKQLEVTITDINRKKSSALNWNQIIEMKNNNIEFGSHTVSHPILSKLDESNLTHEINDSKSDIESHINNSVKTIAYPVGGTTEFSEEVIRKCKNAGYELGLSYISGIETLPIRNVFELKRLHVERYTSFELFKAMLALPQIFK